MDQKRILRKTQRLFLKQTCEILRPYYERSLRIRIYRPRTGSAFIVIEKHKYSVWKRLLLTLSLSSRKPRPRMILILSVPYLSREEECVMQNLIIRDARVAGLVENQVKRYERRALERGLRLQIKKIKLYAL